CARDYYGSFDYW
nr:immunoglobulin heavy chain junction region [Mus musculus]